MNAMVSTLIPIALIIALPIFLFIFNKRGKNFSVKMTHWLLIIYVGVLLLAFLVVSFMKLEEPSLLSDEEQKGINFYETIEKGDILEYKNYLIQEKESPFSGDTLSISANHSGWHSPIFIEKKPEEDEKVEAYLFGNPPHFDDINLKGKIIYPNLRFSDESLAIVFPEFQDINLALAKKEFVINQMTGESQVMMNRVEYESPVLYMRIPSNVKIKEDPSLSFQYIDR